jgi:hypothetical protein
MNKFGSLAADVSKPFIVELIDPSTDEPIRDKGGKIAFVAVWSADSERGRAFDKGRRKQLMLRIRQSRTGKVEPDDALEENIAKCATLTDSWYLVDRLTGEPIIVPCDADNAADLYSPPGLGWLFQQVWGGAINPANFLPKPSKISASTPRPSSEAVDGSTMARASASTRPALRDS